MTITYHLTMTPAYGSERITVEKRGDDLVINGEEYEFHRLADGELYPRAELDMNLFQSNVVREGDTISLTLRYQHGPFAPDTRRREFTRNMTADGALKLWEEVDWGLPDPPATDDQPIAEGQSNVEGQT